MPESEKSAETPVSAPKEEFESFFWCGQKRYQCSRVWEGDIPCQYDTHDLSAMREHMRQPHSRTGVKLAVRPQASPILDDAGNPIQYDAEPDESSFQYRFREEG